MNRLLVNRPTVREKQSLRSSKVSAVVKMCRIFYLLCFQPFGSEKPPAGEAEKYTSVDAEGAAEDKGSKVPKESAPLLHTFNHIHLRVSTCA